MFSITHPKFVFCSEELVEVVREVMKESSSIERVATMKEESSYFSMYDLIKQSTQKPRDFKLKEINSAQDIAMILMSSGTTGFPKAVMLTYQGSGYFQYLSQ